MSQPAKPAGPSSRISPRIYQVRQSYQAAWKAMSSGSEPPRIEDYLLDAAEDEQKDLFLELLALEIENRRCQGEEPQIEEYLQRFPNSRSAVEFAFRNVADYLVLTADNQVITGADHHQTKQPGSGFALGQMLQDRYRLESKLGQGGMGVVYLARDQRLDRPVAVKVIRPPRKEGRLGASREAETHLAFAEEARIGANLTHPAIATVFDFGFHETQPFTVFEYVGGETLGDLLRRRGRLPLEEVRLIVGPLAQGLDFAHGRHVVHRDLKPENIRATEQGQFKILDLGLAREFCRESEWSFAGTPAYASPEQAAGLPCDGRTDQYALGLIVYEMLTGQRPFVSKGVIELLEMHRTQEPTPLGEILPDLPASVGSAVLRALSKEAGHRFASCEELALAIGCQLLSLPTPPSSILYMTHIKRMWGYWRSPPISFSRGIYLILTTDSLWVWHQEEMARWSLAAVEVTKGITEHLSRTLLPRNLQRHPVGFPKRLTDPFTSLSRCLTVWFTIDGRSARQTFLFGHRAQAALLKGRIEKSKANLPPSTLDADGGTNVKPVVLLRQRPNQRFQLLAKLEARNSEKLAAQVELTALGAMIGADAIVDFETSCLTDVHNTVFRCSGTAVQAVDNQGRHDVGVYWLTARVVDAGNWMLTLIALSLLWSLFSGMATAPDRIVLIWRNLFLHAWPFLAVTMLRRFRWPQLLCPTALAVLALCCYPFITLSADVLVPGHHAIEPGPGRRPAVNLDVNRDVQRPPTVNRSVLRRNPQERQQLITPLQFTFLVIDFGLQLSAVLCVRRAWGLRKRQRLFVWDSLERAPAGRLLVGVFAAGLSIAYAIGLGGFLMYYRGDADSALDGAIAWLQSPRNQPSVRTITDDEFSQVLLWTQRDQIFRAATSVALMHQPLHFEILFASPEATKSPEDRFRENIRSEEKAVARNSGPWEWRALSRGHFSFGKHLAEHGKGKEAREHMEQAVAISLRLRREFPDHIVHWGNFPFEIEMAQCLLDDAYPSLRDPARAIELAKAVISGATEDRQEMTVPPRAKERRNSGGHATHSAWHILATAYYQIGSWKDSILAFEEFFKLYEGGDGRDWLYVAMAYHRLGNVEEGCKWLEKAIQWCDQARTGRVQLAGNQRPTSITVELLAKIDRLRAEVEELFKKP
jgi:serine/threonine protein kinase/tetratricopeptide (TPR) repeat protein